MAALKQKIRAIPLATLITVITGCGGGGGGSTEPSPPITNRTPVIESVGDLRIVENEVGVTTVSASDPDGDTLTLSLSGAVADLFELSEKTISFVTPPDFENPSDSDSNNQYALSVSVSDGQASSSVPLQVNVVDAHEGRVVDSPVTGASVFVDDAARPGEQQMLQAWGKEFRGFEHVHHDCEKGCTELRHRAATAPASQAPFGSSVLAPDRKVAVE